MSNLKVTMTDAKGVVRVIDNIEPGISLMEVAKAHDVEGIAGDCGGGCACATCHVYVAAGWWDRVGPADDIEMAMLDMDAETLRDTSRLACQIKMRAELDGLELTVAPSPY